MKSKTFFSSLEIEYFRWLALNNFKLHLQRKYLFSVIYVCIRTYSTYKVASLLKHIVSELVLKRPFIIKLSKIV